METFEGYSYNVERDVVDTKEYEGYTVTSTNLYYYANNSSVTLEKKGNWFSITSVYSEDSNHFVNLFLNQENHPYETFEPLVRPDYRLVRTERNKSDEIVIENVTYPLYSITHYHEKIQNDGTNNGGATSGNQGSTNNGGTSNSGTTSGSTSTQPTTVLAPTLTLSATPSTDKTKESTVKKDNVPNTSASVATASVALASILVAGAMALTKKK